MRALPLAAIAALGISLAACGGAKLDDGKQPGQGGSAGAGAAFETGAAGVVGTGGIPGDGPASAGTGGNCVWANGGGDPQPGPLTCGTHNLNADITATADGAQIIVELRGCDACAGKSLCINRGELTEIDVEVDGSWATVTGQGLATDCPVYSAYLHPASPTSVGLIHITGAFGGADQCHQPLSCPIDELFAISRADDGSVSIATYSPPDGGAGNGGGMGCLSDPSANDPQCHPPDGQCLPGYTCRFRVANYPVCNGQDRIESGICCGLPATDKTGFVAGSSTDACPKPVSGQDPACALPLASSCSVEGLICAYQATLVGSYIQQYTARCCDGAWIAGSTCSFDASTD